MFLLLCEAISNALNDPTEKKTFEGILKRNAIKPKQDWVLNKVPDIYQQYPKKLPDDIDTILIGIFNFIRKQRNNLGHPQDTIPNITRDDAYVYLRIFPNYCTIVSELIEFLTKNKIT